MSTSLPPSTAAEFEEEFGEIFEGTMGMFKEDLMKGEQGNTQDSDIARIYAAIEAIQVSRKSAKEEVDHARDELRSRSHPL